MRIAALLPILLLIATPAAAQAGGDYAGFDAAVTAAKTAMMADPENATAKADVALGRAKALPHSDKAEVAIATAEWLKAESLLYLNRPRDAAPLVAQALTRVERYGRDTKLHGDLLRSKGAVAIMSGKVQEALTDYKSAHEIFRVAREKRSQAIALQDIALTYLEAGDYERVLQYYREAADLYTADLNFTLTTHNNMGEVLRKMGRNAQAVKEFQQALAAARTLKSPMLEVRVLSNLAVAEAKSGDIKAASRTVDRSLHLSRGGEAAGWKPMIYGVAAQVADAKGDLPDAARYLQLAFAGMDLDKTDINFRDFHELAASVFERMGDQGAALKHLRAFQRLDNEARAATASAAGQLAAAEFDFQNQEQKIKDQAAQFRFNLLLGLVVAGGVILLLLLVSALRIRKSRNEVRAANVVLNDTNNALEKALKAKTEFLATTSHEIRTPLNGILGMTQILLANRGIAGEVREQVQVVHGAGEAMRALVDDILDVAKMETGEVTTVREEVRFRTILEDAARLWSGHAEAKHISLHTDIAGAPPMILSDGARLRQIVFNLLSNAIKFTPEGSVTLKSFAEGDTLVVEVQDTGIGIPADHLAKVFEAFHQVDGGTTRQFSGTGLGLSICYNLAEALGGTIDLASEVGVGSTFTLRVPLERVEAVEDPVSGVRPTALGEARMLLVEANPMTQGVFRGLLEPIVGSIDCAEDGFAAIAAIHTGAVDHVLVEAKSAAIDGKSTVDSLALLIAAARERDVPVTLLVAPSEDLPLGDIAALEPTQLVIKPVGGMQLIATLHQAYAPEAAAA